MLPCIVTVEEPVPGSTIVQIVNPEMMMTAGDFQKYPASVEVAREARSRLECVIEKLYAL